MTVGRAFRFPEEQWALRRRARMLSWLSIGLLLVAASFLFLTLGQSQAMKTAWVSDVLTAIPPAALLFAMRFETREPSSRYPWGYFRSIAVAFLVTAAILTIIGAYLLYDSVGKLIRQERPPIGTLVIMGHQLWAGWPMIAALAFSLLVGFTIGKLKEPVAAKLHDKHLEAEATMNRAEWMSEGAAIVGILLVGFGHWWGDAAAAAFISVEIIFDGWASLRQVIADMMDETPSKMGEHEPENLPSRVRRAAEALPWVSRAAVRLREQGHVLTGDVFVELRDGEAMTAAELATRTTEAAETLSEVDWRLHGLVVMPVKGLAAQQPPRL